MAHDAIDIREFAEDDLEAVVSFSLRAWEPVFASVQAVLGDEIFLRLHPDWRTSQEEIVRSICMNHERDVYAAVAGARPCPLTRSDRELLRQSSSRRQRAIGKDVKPAWP